jgi:phosphatidate cytidylyltransferase
MIGYELDLQIVLLSFIVVIFAQAGDFYESWLKRRIGKKDSSKLIPGHGGFLDRFDGLIGGAISVKLYLIFTGSLILVF